MTKSEAAKVVPSTSVAVKKSVPSSPVSSRVPATPSRRDVLFNQFNVLSITQLMGELRARSLHTVGTKSELVERLVAHELKVSVCVEREGKGEKPVLSSLQSESEEQMRLIQKKEEEHKLKLAGNLGTPVSRLPPSAAKPLGTTSRIAETVPVSKPVVPVVPVSKPVAKPVASVAKPVVTAPSAVPSAPKQASPPRSPTSNVQGLKKLFEKSQPASRILPAQPAPPQPTPASPTKSQTAKPSTAKPQVPQVPQMAKPQPPKLQMPQVPQVPQQQAQPQLPPQLPSPTRRIPLRVAPPPQPVQPVQPVQPEEEQEIWYEPPLLEEYLKRMRVGARGDCDRSASTPTSSSTR